MKSNRIPETTDVDCVRLLNDNTLKSSFDFASEILAASRFKSTKCVESIVRVLSKYLNLKACTFYSYYQKTEKLILRYQEGLDYESCEIFCFPVDKAPGRALKEGRPLYISNLDSCADTYYSKWIKKYQLRQVIVIPLTLNERPYCSKICKEDKCQDYLGVVCMYLNDNICIEAFKPFLDSITRIIEDAYIYSVKFETLLLREDIVKSAFYSRDLNSFLYRVISVLKSNWNYEAGSIFLIDDRNSHLTLHATTGIRGDHKKVDVFYTKNDKSMTYQTFNTKTINMVIDPENNYPQGRYHESTSFEKKAVLFIPILRPPDPQVPGNRVIGVLRAINYIFQFSNEPIPCYFSWEDISRLSFVAEIIGTIAFLYEKSSRILDDFERAIHGIHTEITAIKTNLNMLSNYKLKLNMPDELSYIIPNSLSFLESLSWQIDKHTKRDLYNHLQISKVLLTKDVLVNIMDFLNKACLAFNIDKVDINNLKNDNFFQIPPVKGNIQALQIVFRNLAENSLKYTKRGEMICKIRLEWKANNNFIFISFIDFGMGISEKDKDDIFLEGFRSEEALRRNTLGSGIGLAQSKTLSKQMGGDLTLQWGHEKTIFIVSIPIFKDYDKEA